MNSPGIRETRARIDEGEPGSGAAIPKGPRYRRPFGLGQNAGIRKEIESLDAADDCQRIAFLLANYEFPWDMTRSLELALFHTYGSRSVATLLDRTGEFERRGQKRYDDTNILIAQFIEAGWDQRDGQRAIAQMNKIHSNFEIPNDDYLFVLWTFIDFPIDWLDKYGWRAMTPHERDGWFHFWVRIGGLMGIENIPSSKPAFDQFVTAYEARELVPSAESERVARATVTIMENWLPRILRPAVQPISNCLLRENFRRAASYAAPNPILSLVVHGGLKLRAAVKRVVSFEKYPNLLATQTKRTYPNRDYVLENIGPEYAHTERVDP